MKRRTLLTALAAGAVMPIPATILARPAIAQPARKIIFVTQANLTSLDPVWTTATVTRNFALMCYETLYGRDQAMNPQPQMIEPPVIDNDGLRWTMKLRAGQFFHDGTPVLAGDCLASLQRWLRRDAAQDIFAARVDAIEAPDDRTLVWRLKKPFPLLPYFLSKVQPSPVMMPARLAATDPSKQVTDVVGSGPFRFLPGEFVTGASAAFTKFDKYTPRNEPASYTAGGKRVLVDRVEWRVIPDSATAANALTTGEVDWLELPQPDLIPLLKKAAGVQTGLLDIYGTFAILRPNHIQGPTTNPALRRAMMAAIDQQETMIAAMGSDPTTWKVPVGYILPGGPSASEAGMDIVRKRKSIDEIKKMVEQSGYKGERIVMMHPTDQLIYHALATVAVDAFRKVGLNIDDQLTDWGTIVQRRNSKEPLDKGGWSIFPAGAPGPEFVDPLLSNPMRSNGPKAWIGWPDDPRIETAHQAWIDAPTDGERRKLEADYQLAAFDSVPLIPLGQYLPHAAWRSSISGMLRGSAPVFRNVARS